MTFCTRFAPSPTGPLHLGHAYSACLAHDMARAAGGRFLLRIEDLDRARSRPEWTALIMEDLHWLGLTWPEPVMHQSTRTETYSAALDTLWEMGLLYPCHCRRADIRAAASAPQEVQPLPTGPDGLIYPGTCRPDAPASGRRPKDATLRLNMSRATARTGPLTFCETATDADHEAGDIAIPVVDLIAHVGDVVLARRDMAAAYHLAVTLDDAAQSITHVIRGADLFEATAIHVLLQRLLGLPTPSYHHHRLIRDAAGKRLAKRDDARAIRLYRDAGETPAELRRKVGL